MVARRRMMELFRPRKKAAVTVLRCFRCGVTRELEDDGRRAHHAKVHMSSCASAPAELAQMNLVSSNHLEMRLDDGSTWFEIRRE